MSDTEKMTITDEAVEAAALAFIAIRSPDHFTSPAEYAAAMLEAAAPHMLAEAWDEGSIAGWVESGLPHSWNAENSLRNGNPYRISR